MTADEIIKEIKELRERQRECFLNLNDEVYLTHMKFLWKAVGKAEGYAMACDEINNRCSKVIVNTDAILMWARMAIRKLKEAGLIEDKKDKE